MAADMNQYLRELMHECHYKQTELAIMDITNTMAHYVDLKPHPENFLYPDGKSRKFVCLSGTVPVMFKGAGYNIPVAIWVMANHPSSAPVCYAKPTPEMDIRQGRHVDASGRIYMPYLNEWKQGTHDLVGLVQSMSILFGEDPPVVTKATCTTQPITAAVEVTPEAEEPVPEAAVQDDNVTLVAKLYQDLEENIENLVRAIVVGAGYQDIKLSVDRATSSVSQVAHESADSIGRKIVTEHEMKEAEERVISQNELEEAVASQNGVAEVTIVQPWTREAVLGGSSFGVVHRAVDQNGIQFAAKELPRGKVKEENLEEHINSMKRLSHKNITRYYGYEEAEECVYIFMELMQKSIRAKLDSQNGPLSNELARKYTSEMLQGLEYLHSQDIIHQNIKCANLLLDSADRVKLADMGLQKIYHQKKLQNHEYGADTFFWMSPEAISGRTPQPPSDIWAAGCTVYEMVKSNPPFFHCSELGLLFGPVIASKIMRLEHFDLVKADEEMDELVQKFLMKIFVKVEQRPPIADIQRDEWLEKSTYA